MDRVAQKMMKARAELSRAAEHWQKDLAYGRGAWAGDRALVLYYKPLTHTLEVWYELPGRKPEVVIKDMDADTFDINLLCQRLYQADNRNVSVEEKMDQADAHNDKLKADTEKKADEQTAEMAEKLDRALSIDTGRKTPRLVVP